MVAIKSTLVRSGRQGVTLLELILAMSLAIAVLMAISMAINLHFRMLDVRRTNVEEARLASAVLKHMADDLRSAVQYTPPDLSGLEALTSSLSSSGATALAGIASQAAGAGGAISGAAGGSQGSGAGGGTGGGGQQGTGGGTGAQATAGGQQGTGGAQGGQTSGGSQTTTSGSTPSGGAGSTSTNSQASSGTTTSTTTTGGSTTQTAATSTVVGFFGTSTELRFDIARLPRIDQYEATLSSSGDSENVEFPSDLKTVVYFLQNDDNGQAIIDPGLGAKVAYAEPSTSGRGRGLMRSEQDRAVLALAESSGNDTAVYTNSKLLAEEVVGLAFQYFDGTEWLTEWDSSTTHNLPRAVEIVITMQPTYALKEADLAQSATAASPPEYNFRLVVRLPSAPLVAPTTTEGTTTDPASSTSGGTTASPASGTQAQGTMP